MSEQVKDFCLIWGSITAIFVMAVEPTHCVWRLLLHLVQ